MARYGMGRLTTNTTSGQAAMDVANSTGIRAVIREWAITLTAATASTYGLNRTTALGTRTSPVALESLEDGAPVLTGITLVDTALAHSVQPTLGTNYLRRQNLPATIGAGRVWTFDGPVGLRAAISLSIALVNLAANGAVNSEVEVDV